MKRIIGIDEAGRGPIAGPVAVSAFACNARGMRVLIAKVVREKKLPLRDSKKLSKLQRERWFAEIIQWRQQGKCDFYVSMTSAKSIDTKGISYAIKRSLRESLSKIKASISDYIFLDGSLYAPKEFKNQKTIIKGDEKVPVISLSSICAKVIRDGYLLKLSKKFPKYGFEQHKGYGTKLHYKRLKKFGISNMHRKSFLKKIIG